MLTDGSDRDDAWLTAHDNTVRAEALTEAAHSGLFGPHDIITLERLAEHALRGDN
jgi:hypothetical protein